MKYGISIAVMALSLSTGCSLIVDPQIEGGTGGATLGATCTAGTECDSGVCRSDRCTQACDASTPCPANSGGTCGADAFCQFGTEAFGAACTTNGNCSSGICLSERCSQACTASAPCPGDATECNSMGQCEFLVTGAGPYAGRCAAPSDCETGRCVNSRCTKLCGEGMTCDAPGVCGTDNLCEFSSPPPIDDPKVGLLYVGPVGDHGWTLTHERGRQYFMENVDGVSSEFVPAVAAADAPRVIDELISNGNNIIVGTSFDFLVPFLSKAPNNPDVNFLLCAGFENGPNLGSYFGRMYQVMYMMGVMAGRVTRNDRIGIVGPVVIPETVRHANAFTLGARSVNPNVEVYIEWVEAWFNPPVETSATQALLDVADVDIVFGFTDTTIPIEIAATATTSTGDPVYVIGYDNRDSCTYTPEITPRCLTSAYWNWGPMVTRLLEDMKAGTWKPEEQVWEQMRSSPEASSAYFSELNTDLVDTSVRLEVEGLIPMLTADSEEARQLPFAPPIRDVGGMERLAVGETFNDQDLLEMCWLVDGILNVDGSPGTVPANCVGVR